EPGSFSPKGAVALSVDTRTRMPLLDATLETRSGTSVPARLVVDLGSSALSLRLASSFVEKHRDAFAGLQGVVAPIGAGVGGRLAARRRHRKGRRGRGDGEGPPRAPARVARRGNHPPAPRPAPRIGARRAAKTRVVPRQRADPRAAAGQAARSRAGLDPGPEAV